MGRENIGETVINDLYKTFINNVLPVLIRIADESRRYLLFLAWLNTELEKRNLGRIIITGGFAVEVYTARIYRTMDVDIVVEGSYARDVVEGFLRMFSERIGRGFLPIYEVLQLKSIDIVSTVYRKKASPTKIVINSFSIYLEPVEELVVTYLAGWKFWGATEDRDKAIWLYVVWRDKMDIEYLELRALEENVLDYLKELEKVVQQNI